MGKNHGQPQGAVAGALPWTTQLRSRHYMTQLQLALPLVSTLNI